MAVHVSPGAIGCDSVSVPELTSSPAASGSAGGWRAMADASSPRQSAGLRSEFLPDPPRRAAPSLQQPDLEARQLLDERGNQLRLDASRLTDHERGVQPERRDEVGRLELPVGKHAVDDFESQRQPFDRVEHRGRIAASPVRGAASA